MKLSYLALSICLLFPQTALGQICSMSRPMGDHRGLNWSLMHGRDLKASDKDYPFLDQNAGRNRYAQLWVNADVLNIRSGPALEYEIISESVAELRVSDCNRNVHFMLWERIKLRQI